jgi:transcriptional regulator with XRE-family HTH domain
VFARRVKEARVRLGMTQRQLADRTRELGLPLDRTTIVKLERGERAQTAPLDKVFVIAAALGVPPVHLLVPLDDEAEVQLTPGKPYKNVPATLARAWIRGQIVLPASDVNWSELPESELRRLVEQELARGMDPVARALMQDELRETARRIADEIRQPE